MDIHCFARARPIAAITASLGDLQLFSWRVIIVFKDERVPRVPAPSRLTARGMPACLLYALPSDLAALITRPIKHAVHKVLSPR